MRAVRERGVPPWYTPTPEDGREAAFNALNGYFTGRAGPAK